MSTHLPEEQQTQQDKSSNTRIRYIEELADEADAWVSITDAARMTRTSEAMTRRWVTSGRLPVKRQAVGINQHTRLVRLSDIASIRPIIDPTAAISDELHKLDLPSIPRQQAQLMHDHKHLLQQVLAGQQTFEELLVQVRNQKIALEQSQQDLLEHEEKVHHEMELLHTTIREQMKTTQTTMLQVIQERVDALTEQNHGWQAHMEHMHHDLMTLYDRQNEQVQKAIGETAETVRRQCEEIQQTFTEQQKTFAGQQEAVTQLVETQIETIKDSLRQHVRNWEQDHTMHTERVESIEQQLEQVVARGRDTYSIVLEYQKRVITCERQLKTLTKTSQEEIKERKRLSEHFFAQQKQIQLLRRELDILRRQKEERTIAPLHHPYEPKEAH